jgi:addiction module HigA family antidote
LATKYAWAIRNSPLGGILVGVAIPTEAALLGVIAGILIGGLLYRELSVATFARQMLSALRTVGERRGVTADTALRLGRYFNTDPRFWLNAQVAHDLSKAESEVDLSSIPNRAA